ncbi:MAG TPA: hypothetical protein VEW28_00280 [Candidatus Kapabacteria bacterium]|nr:hypothetical protein [Candidatus Kapabacteria bacterium]
MKYRLVVIAATLFAVFLNSCKSSSTDAPAVNSSWGSLQQKVITPVCTGCHTAGSDYALQSGLVLTSDVAYANLVGVAAHNTDAHNDGILRVKVGSADSSLLYMKLHGLPQGKNYGSPMPLGYKPLSVGQLKFIDEWIAAGAPSTGVVADASLLDDTTQSPPPTFAALPPPSPGQGYQMHLDSFTIANNFEREIFVYKKLGNPTDIYVNRIQTRMRENSHHFILYTFDPSMPSSMLPKYNVVRDLRNPDGSDNGNVITAMEYHVFLGGSTTPDFDYFFPPGTALRIPANTAVDMNSHYVNYTGAPITGEVYANLYTVPQSQVTHVAQTLLWPQTNLNLPAHKETVITTDNMNNGTGAIPLYFIMLTSHTHARGEKFRMLFKGKPGDARTGTVLYESTDWAHPLIKNLDTPLVINPGEGITTEVTYYNGTDQDITFGFTSKDEMDILIGYYYF